ncbi:MAG: SAM-dependent methyltransferase, partial [Cyanobacteria bacterium J06649_11]
KRNFRANGADPEQHEFIRADVKQWLAAPAQEQYDIIVLDPPTFSNSKAMNDVLDTQRDHVELIKGCMQRLAPEGTLYFSTNNRRFKLDEEAVSQLTEWKEITKQTSPPDYRKRIPHRCWKLNDIA